MFKLIPLFEYHSRSAFQILSKALFKLNAYNNRLLVRKFHRTMSDDLFLNRVRQCIPVLGNDLHKGQSGRIGVVGGSFEYTGAPYFAGMSALKIGADLVHIFCCRDAAIPIKSYSPELMVHPVLDDAVDPIKQIEPWLERLHVLVIGPGLGRNESVFSTVRKLIGLCRNLNKPLVLDADALFLVSQDLSVISNYPNAILTPNVVEFSRIFGQSENAKTFDDIGSTVTILKKGYFDVIYSGEHKTNNIVNIQGGDGRRCGGQGDILSGCLAVFFAWAIKSGDPDAAKIACFGASDFVKKLNSTTFRAKGRSMTATDMIEHIHPVFKEHFEHK